MSEEGIMAEIEKVDQIIARFERMLKIATECGFEYMANTLWCDIAEQKVRRYVLAKSLE